MRLRWVPAAPGLFAAVLVLPLKLGTPGGANISDRV
jgi:hypothetical protein